MYTVPVDSPYVVDHETVSLAELSTTLPEQASKKALKARLGELTDELYELQRRFYAADRRALLLVFQAMDAAGKDSTIRSVFSGVNPAGFQVHSFKQPSKEELDHDFLWRTACRLPERGRIGVFNRSYYEEVLVVRVHPEYLGGQRVDTSDLDALWAGRFQSIRDHEAHLARNGTVILKFFLNVSQREQHRRFLARLDTPRKQWKFSSGDLAESALWPAYQAAYQDVLAETSRPWAPWLAIPADDKPSMRVAVAEAVASTLRNLDPQYPEVSDEDRAMFAEARAQLRGEGR